MEIQRKFSLVMLSFSILKLDCGSHLSKQDICYSNIRVMCIPPDEYAPPLENKAFGPYKDYRTRQVSVIFTCIIGLSMQKKILVVT